jgi:uncharacterized membrane protein YuzA (DUF378 family)
MNTIDNLSLVLVIVGALNWASIGLFKIDLIGTLFGGQLSLIPRIIYTIVGIAGLWTITLLFKDKLPAENRR